MPIKYTTENSVVNQDIKISSPGLTFMSKKYNKPYF